MPSGVQRILPRMRISADALRVSTLVAAGVASGYLWRAAFETGSLSGGEPVAPTLVAPAQAAELPPAQIPSPAARHHGASGTKALVSSRLALGPTETGRGAGVPGPRPRPGTSSPKPGPNPPGPTPAPTPSPSPTPAPAPPSTPSTPTGPNTTPTTTTPTPASPPPTTPPPTTPTPPPPSNPGTQPPPTTGEDQTRPGWGYGDKNHDHTGPPKKP
jgi:hypothetical protein